MNLAYIDHLGGLGEYGALWVTLLEGSFTWAGELGIRTCRIIIVLD